MQSKMCATCVIPFALPIWIDESISYDLCFFVCVQNLTDAYFVLDFIFDFGIQTSDQPRFIPIKMRS